MTTYIATRISVDPNGNQLTAASTNPDIGSTLGYTGQQVDLIVDYLNASTSLTGMIPVFGYNGVQDLTTGTNVYQVNLTKNQYSLISQNTNGQTGNAASTGGNTAAAGVNTIFNTASTNITTDGSVSWYNPNYTEYYNGVKTGFSNVYWERTDYGSSPWTFLASSAADGTAANADSWGGTGSYFGGNSTIVFDSNATNLVSTATDGNTHVYAKYKSGFSQLGLTSEKAGAIHEVDVNQQGVAANASSFGALTDTLGVVTVYESKATNLVTTATNGAAQIYYSYNFDNSGMGNPAPRTRLISSDSNGVAGNADSGIDINDRIHYAASINSGDNLIAFQSKSTNLVDGMTNGMESIYVKSLADGKTLCVSQNQFGQQANGNCYNPYIVSPQKFASNLGTDKNYYDTFIVFESDATNLVPNANTGNVRNIYLKDMASGAVALVSQGPDGTPANGSSYNAKLSLDGSTIIFQSDASNLITSDTNNVTDIFTVQNPFMNRIAGNIDTSTHFWKPINNGSNLPVPVITGNNITVQNGQTAIPISQLFNVDVSNTPYQVDQYTFKSSTAQNRLQLNGAANQMGPNPSSYLIDPADGKYTWSINASDIAKVTWDTTNLSTATLKDAVSLSVLYGTGWNDLYNTPYSDLATITVTNQNHAPIVTVVHNTNNLMVGKTVSLNTMVNFSDPDSGDTVSQVKIANATNVALNGATNYGNATDITVNYSDFGKLTYTSPTTGSATLSISATDGKVWSEASSVTITNNSAIKPTLSALPTNISHHDVTVNLGQYISAQGNNGDNIQQYKIIDPSGLGSVSLNGATNLSNTSGTYIVSPADLSKLTYTTVGNIGSNSVESLQVQAYDGNVWSDTQTIAMSNLMNHLPTIKAVSISLQNGQTVKFSDIVSAADADGDAIVQYSIGYGLGFGSFNLNGVTNISTDPTKIRISAGDLSKVTFTGFNQSFMDVTDVFTIAAADTSNPNGFGEAATVSIRDIAKVAPITPTPTPTDDPLKRVHLLSNKEIKQLDSGFFGSLNQDEVRALSPSQISAIDPGAVTALPISYFTDDQLAALTKAQIAAFGSGIFGALTAEQFRQLGDKVSQISDINAIGDNLQRVNVSALTTEQVASINVANLTTTQVNSLSNKQIKVLGGGQIGSLSNDVIATLSNSFISTLATDQISSLRISSLSTSQITALNNKQIAALDAGTFGSMGSDQIAALNGGQVAAITDINGLGGNISYVKIGNITPKELAILSNVSALTTTQLNGLSGGQIKVLTTEQINNLSNDQVSGMAANVVKNFTTTQIAALAANHLAAMTAAQIAALSTAQLAALPGNQFGSLNSDQVKSITPNQIKGFTTDQFNALTGDQIKSFTTVQIQALSTAAFAALNQDQMGAITTDQIKGISVNQIKVLPIVAINTFSQEQVNAMTGNQIKALSTVQLNGLNSNLISGLSSTQIGALATQQLAGLTTDQLSQLTIDQIDALTGSQIKSMKIGKLTGSQIAGLTTAQVKALTTEQVASLITDNLVGLNSDQIDAMSNAQIKALSLKQLQTMPISVFTTAQVNALDPTNFAKLENVNTLTSTQIAALSAPLMQALTTTQLATMSGEEMAAFSPKKMSSFAANQLKGIPTNNLTTDQVAAISATQFSGLSADFVNGLSAEQLAVVKPTNLANLSISQFSKISASQIGNLTTKQVVALGDNFIKALSTEQFAGLTATQIDNLSAAEMAAITAPELEDSLILDIQQNQCVSQGRPHNFL